MSQTIEIQLTSEQKESLNYVARLILKGSEGRLQVQGRYFKKESADQAENGCCSLGACLLAVGAPEDNSLVLSDYLNLGNWPNINYPDDTEMWKGWNSSVYANKPLMNLTDVIMQLNDAAGWSFRRIAAYLRLAAQRGVVITTTP